MSQLYELPDVGEGLTEATIVSWRVAAGDTVAVNDVLVEIETAKSLVELPSPFAGVIGDLLVAEGDLVEVGTAILRMREEPGQAAKSDGEVANLVGYGSGGGTRSRRGRRRGSAAERRAAAPSGAAPEQQPANAAASRGTAVSRGQATSRGPAASAYPVIAKPPIRKLARDLDVDLERVQPTGVAGEVTRDDVIRHAEQARLFTNIETPEWSDVREERHPVEGVRKMIAQNMVKSMFTAPHVTLFVDVDATRTMEFVKRLKASPDYADVKVSPLLIVAKAVMWAIRRNPTTNATWTDSEYTIKHYVNLGIAAATPRGLIVPNIKEAQSMSMRELAQALQELTITAREGKTTPADQQGGTFTITNIGVFGMDSGTPILNPGEVGILAFGTVRPKPWVVDDEVRVRQVTTLTASFDHRLVDGDVASRFLADVAKIVEEPALLLD